MLSKTTVFVLGAGASQPFGFPTGIELSRIIIASLQEGEQGWQDLQEFYAFQPAAIAAFREEFLYSAKNSIDAFLEHRNELLEIGKASIAWALVRFEDPQALFKFDGNWLRYLYDKMNATRREFSGNKLSFITFNYDRSVEYFFFRALKHTYNMRDEEAVSMLRRVPVIHLHGRLAYLPWQVATHTRPYSAELNTDAIKRGIENISIIHEVTEEFVRAKEVMEEAEQIFFLGFGFNKTNVERLGITNLTTGKAKATAFGLVDHERDEIQQICGAKVALYDCDCLSLLRQHVEWN